MSEKFPQEREKIHQLWEFLYECYLQPWRHYHTMGHIDLMRTLFDDIKKLLKNPWLVETAIWYHDCVYIPGSKLNEKMSAQTAAFNLSFLHSRDLLDEDALRYLIEGRADPRKSIKRMFKNDWKYFRDMDYAIVAADSSKYDLYVHGVYLEYRQTFTKMEIKKGREIFLKKLLPRIFLTEYFRDLYGKQAKENIERELANSDNITEGIY